MLKTFQPNERRKKAAVSSLVIRATVRLNLQRRLETAGCVYVPCPGGVCFYELCWTCWSGRKWFAITQCSVSECSSCSSCCCGWSPYIFLSPAQGNKTPPPPPVRKKNSSIRKCTNRSKPNPRRWRLSFVPVWFWPTSRQTARRSFVPAPAPVAFPRNGNSGRSCSPPEPLEHCHCPSPC